MESKKITQLATEVAPLLDDLTFIGDPITGQLKKVTLNQIAYIFGAGSAWGTITGTLSNQTDLQAALNLKANDSEVVHLAGTETIIGAKTFANNVLVNNGTTGNYIGIKQYGTTATGASGFTSISATGPYYFNINFGAGKSIIFDSLALSTNRIYTFPNAEGTIALTSDLTSYVPYTGATANVDLGVYSLTSSAIISKSISAIVNGTASSPLILKTGTSGLSFASDAISLISSPTSANTLSIYFDVATVKRQANFNANSLTATRTYTLPDATGTLALTSDLTSFITLTSLSATSPLAYNNTTGAFSIQVANTSQNGYLSSTDWNTFNGKQNALTNPVTGTGTTNYVPKFTGTSAIGDSLIQSSTYAIGIGGGVASWDLNYRSINLYGINNYITGADNGALYLGNGAYFNSGWKYSNGNSPTQISMETGSFTFKVALGGTTGNAISWITGLSVASGTGNVIIGGATDAGFKLDVNGTARVSGMITSNTGNNTRLFTSTGATTGYQYMDMYNTTGRLVWGINGSTANALATNSLAYGGVIYAENSLQLGVGGDMKLTIASTGAATFSSTGAGANFRLTNGTTNIYAYLSSGTTSLLGSGTGMLNNISFDETNNIVSLSTNGTPRLTINSSGNVGIGTSSPSSLLQLAGGGIGTRGALRFSDAGLSNYWEIGRDNNVSGDFTINSNSAERMRITSAGNVGIGTSSPSAAAGTALAIYGNSSQARLALKNSATGNAADDGFQLAIGTDGGAIVDQRENNYLMFTTNATERMRITSGGNVGIGNTGSANTRLSINGVDQTSTNYALAVSGSSSLYIYVRNDGYLFSSSAWSGSDRRLKENIIDLDNGLNKILNLKARKFDFIDGFKNQFGFIAQEMQEIIPDAVSIFQEEEQMLAIKMDFIVPHLVKAIQEQNEIITKQGQAIEELKALINK